MLKAAHARTATRTVSFVIAIAAAAFPAAARPNKSQSQSATGIRLQPRFVPGEVMRYQIEFQIETDMKNSGAVEDPEGPAQRTVTWDATIRLEVLPLAGSPGPTDAARRSAAPAGIRVRTTYEKSSAAVRSDTPDPQAENIERTYSQLEGVSFEFTLGRNGRVSDVHGLENLITDQAARAAAQQWVSQLSGSGGIPGAGVTPGQRWTSERPADSVPLAGLSWRTDSTYLRNEPCRPATPSGTPGTIGGQTCAVILTSLGLESKHAPKNSTPEDYRRNGLRTSGNWSGSGQSLNYVSLSSGWLVSSTQEATQEMDLAILRPGDTALHYAGKVRTHSTISLELPDLVPVEGPAGSAPAKP